MGVTMSEPCLSHDDDERARCSREHSLLVEPDSGTPENVDSPFTSSEMSRPVLPGRRNAAPYPGCGGRGCPPGGGVVVGCGWGVVWDGGPVAGTGRWEASSQSSTSASCTSAATTSRRSRSSNMIHGGRTDVASWRSISFTIAARSERSRCGGGRSATTLGHGDGRVQRCGTTGGTDSGHGRWSGGGVRSRRGLGVPPAMLAPTGDLGVSSSRARRR